MIYTWKNKKTGQIVCVERKVKDIEICPDKKETGSNEPVRPEEWERVVTGGSLTIGFGLKGRW